MSRYRKIPVEVEAEQYVNEGIVPGIVKGDDGRLVDGVYWRPSGKYGDDIELTIRTLEGRMVVSVGDWIIRGVKGELYPCKPDVSALTYEEAQP